MHIISSHGCFLSYTQSSTKVGEEKLVPVVSVRELFGSVVWYLLKGIARFIELNSNFLVKPELSLMEVPKFY